ncbi:peptidoglycan-binding protein [Herbidospora galbida]|uniref:Peptidoglycan-binding protein n=1 Tax=Herbidospora galbida TaxID=2575442 RepID=A0A4V6XBG6_9ACTN|nr:peptidoglycan-binding protein [Herbidospora galbida]
MAVQLAKALIVDTHTGDRMPVMYNPDEYRIEQGNELAEIGIPGLAASPVQYVRGRARTLTMDLFFDTYERQTDVRAFTNRLAGLLRPAPRSFAPPVLLFVMGRFSFRCVLAEADQRFTMFLPDGTPVRARVSVAFREFTEVEVETRRGFFAGPPTLHDITDRDTLPGLAATYLGDPGRWREIADANDLLDPLRLRLGRPLVIPER